jgi:hypothetical protein
MGPSTLPSSYRFTLPLSLQQGGNEAIMANYFPVALIGTARSWLMNLSEGSLTS